VPSAGRVVTLTDESAPEFGLRCTAGREVGLVDELETGLALVTVNRGHWCRFCVGQLRTFDDVAEDLRFNEHSSTLPVITAPLPRLVEMRDRSFQLLAGPDGEAAERTAARNRRATA